MGDPIRPHNVSNTLRPLLSVNRQRVGVEENHTKIHWLMYFRPGPQILLPRPTRPPGFGKILVSPDHVRLIGGTKASEHARVSRVLMRRQA